MRPVFLIFSGYNNRAVITFIRKLESYRIEYAVVAAGRSDEVLRTQYANKVVLARIDFQLTLSFINKVLTSVRESFSGSEIVYAPTTEALNRFMLEHRAQIEKLGLAIPLGDLSIYEMLSNKLAFTRCCMQHGIQVPAQYEDPRLCPLPFVAKRKVYSQAPPHKPQLVHTESERQRFLNENVENQFYFQEFVAGRSIYLLVYRGRDGHSQVFSQENLLQQPNGNSIIAARVADYHESVGAQEYLRMLETIGFHGLVMVEVRLQDDREYMIEANPRFWGPLQLQVDAMETDLLDEFLRDLGCELTDNAQKQRKNCYFWYEGYIETLRSDMQPTYYNYSPEQFAGELPQFIESDLYNRPDTRALFNDTLREARRLELVEQLTKLYLHESKHSSYQELPICLRDILKEAPIDPTTRHEIARRDFILKHLSVNCTRVRDIGANTGYFTFELLGAGATAVIAYEGNPEHARFIELAAETVDLDNRIVVRNEYFEVGQSSDETPVDLTLLMNVLHHVGDDYGKSTDIEQAREQIAHSLQIFAETTSYMAFQLGYNWKGNCALPLFTYGTKTEQIDFFNTATAGYWDVVAIGIAENRPEGIVYSPPSPSNLIRQDKFGEFLNRPLFLCRSLIVLPNESHR